MACSEGDGLHAVSDKIESDMLEITKKLNKN